MAFLRHLTLASFSLIVSCLDRTCCKLGLNTLVHTIDQFCFKHLTAHEIVSFVVCRGDLPCRTRFEKLYFMTYGSPKLWFILKKINHYCLLSGPSNKSRKLLITEDIPVNAFFIELTCKLAYIQIEILHAGLTDIERVNLVKRFNNPKDSLLVLVIMYQVSA